MLNIPEIISFNEYIIYLFQRKCQTEAKKSHLVWFGGLAQINWGGLMFGFNLIFHL